MSFGRSGYREDSYIGRRQGHWIPFPEAYLNAMRSKSPLTLRHGCVVGCDPVGYDGHTNNCHRTIQGHGAAP